jgi:peptidoglycan/LPS O-acetylase OafA/YrhL
MRSDIQSLRGYAILSVLLFHAHIPFVPGGYLGVDIFFVISGFLITNLIAKQIQNNTFSFREFYFRRAKRLLPAAYTTFFISALAAPMLLSSQELVDYSKQLIGAVTFTANMVLWRQGTYFGVESGLKPLLHIWSLSIEEQYYFLLPAILFFTTSKNWVRIIFGLFLLSIITCVVMFEFQASAAFYLFPARAWELCIGSLGAFYWQKQSVVKVSRVLFVPAVLVIIYITLRPIGGMHPGWDSLLACVGTILIILSNYQKPFSTILGKFLSWLGDISYSLYLVHWVIFAYVYNVWFDREQFSPLIAVVCIGISVLIGFLQYKYIEYPIHKASFKFSNKYTLLGLAASLFLIVIALVISNFNAKANDHYLNARRGNTGFGQPCTFKGDFIALKECQSTDTPDILVWGDSNAMHLVPGIHATRGEHSVVQATKYVCGPLVGVAPLGLKVGMTQNQQWAKSCIDFNESVLSYLEKNNSIKTVILSSFFSQYLTYDNFELISGENGTGVMNLKNRMELSLFAMRNTIKRIRGLGKKVVIVAPPPALNFDVGRCIERVDRDLPNFGKYKDCSPLRSEIEEFRATVYQYLSITSNDNDVNVIYFNDYLERDKKIIPAIDGDNIFIANAHLSYSGSLYLAKKMNLLGQAVQLAK